MKYNYSKYKTAITTFLISLIFSNTLSAQTTVKDLKTEDFISDFDILVKIIKKQHPNPYKFISEKSFDHKVDSLRKILVLNPNIYSFGSLSVTKLLKDVHTSLALSDEIGLEVYKAGSYFPYPIYIERGRVFVNIKGKEIPYGAEIISINNSPVRAILKNIGSGNSDGNIPTGIDRMSDNFVSSYSYSMPHAKSYTVSFIKQGETQTNTIVANTCDPSKAYYNASKAVMPFNLITQHHNIYSEFIDAKQTGVITVNTFNLTEQSAYKEFSKFFKDVNQRKYKNVIIDVRNNGGGDPSISALLYSFITKTPFANQYTYKTKNIKLAYPEYIIGDNNSKPSDEHVRSSNDYMYQRFDKDTVSGFYVGNARLDEGLISNFPPDKDTFTGNVYILTGSRTISAATYFASLVKKNNRGTIIGKETSSGVDATTAAWFVNYQLPKTKSILALPLSEIYFFNATQDSGRGLMPDKEVPIKTFIQYMLEDKDPEMSFTLDSIK